MGRRRLARFATALLAAALAVSAAAARELTFDERVRVQQEIERVYYEHQIGTSRAFENAVSPAMLEGKVERYLKQTVALEESWHTRVTAEMLQRELERIVEHTRMPERLRQLLAAVGDDPFLARECLARPALVDRLARGFFARDGRFSGRTWESWWDEVSPGLDGARVVAPDLPGSTLPQVKAPCHPDDTWQDLTVGHSPVPRVRSTAVWTGSLVIVWGGQTNIATGDRYDPALDTWTPTSMVGAPPGRYFHTAVWTGSAMLVWGGAGSGVLSTGGRYDPAADAWTPMSTVDAPSPRYVHTAVWTGTRMLVWGGLTPGVTPTPIGTGGSYDPQADVWTPISTTNAPAPCWAHTAVWTGTRMIVWGGAIGATTTDAGGRYDPETDSWTPTSTSQAPSARYLHVATWTGVAMVVWGGHYNNTGGRYDPESDTWAATSTVGAPAGRAEAKAVWTGAKMIVWGGSNGGGTAFDTGGRYDPATDAWVATTTTNAPSARWGHTAVWTGELMIVWAGGGTGESPPEIIQDGGRYDPATDTWTPTSIGLPDPHARHTAVWTGNLMIVWGGYGISDPVGTGARYDPATDTWSHTSTLGAPSPRSAHTAVWTGEAMVVWGGSGGGEYLNSGARYDPIADTWWSTSTIGAPPKRSQHTAVWTGSRMIVWGGHYNDTANQNLDTGGLYDPTADAWTPTSTVHPPLARVGHIAVWTGDEMVVWGGTIGNSAPWPLTNTGARLDPATNSWKPMSTAGAPSKRDLHTAVWTGGEMIVWGGSEDAGGVAPGDHTGGRYDPASDSWAPTPTDVAPAGRVGHTAIWTGSQMIVWGGTSTSGSTDTGGRYDPTTSLWAPLSSSGAPSPRAWHTAVWNGSAMIVWGGQKYDPFNTGAAYNIGQAVDDDGDGLTECDGDCNDAEAGAHAVPAEVGDVRFTDKITLEWDSATPAAGSATVHDVASGVVGELPAGSGAGEICLASTAAATTIDEALPPPGSAYWYLVRGRNICGAGTYGQQSDGHPRNVAACP